MPTEYFFQEGCFITELHNVATDPACSVAQARVEPGRTTAWHALAGTSERYVVVSGVGLVEIGDEPMRHMGPGDVAVIPADVRQRIHNPGSNDLVFLAICTPRFEPANYREVPA